MRLTAVAGGTIAVVVAVCLPACGDDSDPTEAQPLPGASVFQEGDFDQIPRFPGAVAANEPTVEDDVTTQSFYVEPATPERVMKYYTDELEAAGWAPLDEPGRVGADDTYRGVWVEGGRQLVVSSTRAAGFDEPGAGRRTQYSLSLGPAE